MFADAGLPATGEIRVVPNSRKALRLGELARERGRFEALHPRLFDAYWARGLDIGADDVLLGEARTIGLDEDEARDVLASDRYLEVVERDTRRAVSSGVTGVPAWVLDERYLVPGAQPHEAFERVLVALGHEARQS
jgi:predicted DsbA family dithiol-disulfide isomerase